MQAWMNKVRQCAASRRLRRGLAWTAGVVAVYALLGFAVLPMVVKSQLQSRLQTALGRPVSVQTVRMNPFVLSLEVRGLRVGSKDGGGQRAVAGFERLYANLQLQSVWRGGVVLRELSLQGPRLVVIRHADGSLNWSDLLQPAKPDEAPAASSGKVFPFALNNIRINSGQFTFVDEEKGEQHEVSAMELGIPFLSSLKNDVDTQVQPLFKARLDGAPVLLQGQTRLFGGHREASLQLDVQQLDLARYARWIPLGGGYRLTGGLGRAAVRVAFTEAADHQRSLDLSGQVGVRDFMLADGENHPAVAFSSLDVDLGTLQPLQRDYRLARVHLSAPLVALRRLPDGSLDLRDIAPPSDPNQPSAPVKVGLGELLVENGKVVFDDQAVPDSKPLALDGLRLQVKNFAWPAGQPASVELALQGEDGMTLSQQGSLQLQPMQAQGAVQLKGLALARLLPYLRASFPQLQLAGTVGAQGKYSFAMEGATPHYAVQDGALQLDTFSLGRRDAKGNDLSLAALKLDKVQVNGDKHLVQLGDLHLKQPGVRVERRSDGALSLMDAFAQPPVRKAGKGDRLSLSAPATAPIRGKRTVTAAKAPAAAAPWAVELAQLDLADGSVDYRDSALPGGLQISLSGIAGQLKDFTTRPGHAASVDLKARVDKRGEIALRGKLTPAPLDTDLRVTLQRLPLNNLQRVLASRYRLDLQRGSLEGSGRLRFALDGKGQPKGDFRGSLGLRDLKVDDPGDHSELLHLRSLSAKGVNVALQPMAAAVDDVALDDFFARLRLEPDGKLNLSRLSREEAPAQPAPAAAAPKGTAKAGASTLPALRLGSLSLRNSAVDFSDQFIKPNYRLHMAGIEGDLQNLTTDPKTLAKLNLKARAASTARVTLSGELNPFREDRYLDLRAAVRGFELPALSAYSGRYVGYGIESGVFSADLEYKVEDRKLTATNQLFLDQLNLGDKVDSPDAVNLPVGLAIALLKDSSGRIRLDLPVAGSLDNPEFSIGGVLAKAVVNLFAKAITSPFTLLASALGSSAEELSRIGFDPGYANLDEAATERLQRLAKALQERPSLTLTMHPLLDAQEDRHALKWAWIWGKLHAARLASSGKDQGDISGEEYPVLLRKVYVQTDMDKPRNFLGFTKDATVPEMEQRLLAHLQTSDDELLALGQRRAQAAKVWLVEKGGVEPTRIRIEASEIKAPAKEGEDTLEAETFTSSRVDFSLR